MLPIQAEIMSSIEHPFVVDVGACDGIFKSETFTGLKHGDWSGLLIEPVADRFEKLAELYLNNLNVVCLKIAVLDKNGPVIVEYIPLDRINRESREGWRRGMGHVLTAPPKGSKGVDLERVLGLTLNTVFELCGVSKVDGLFVDAEGSDSKILMALDLAKYRPKVVKAELGHDGSKMMAKEVEIKFEEAGYSTRWNEKRWNWFAWLPGE